MACSKKIRMLLLHVLAGSVGLGILGSAAPVQAGPAHDEAAQCDGPVPAVRELPQDVLDDIALDDVVMRHYGYGLAWNDPTINMGIGLLTPGPSDSFVDRHNGVSEQTIRDMWAFLKPLRIPLFSTPHGEQWGWYAEKLLVDLTGSTPMAVQYVQGFLTVNESTVAFVALNVRDDGWVEFRWGGGEHDLHGGTAWTHRCFLRGEDYKVTFTPYADILSRARSPFNFRNESVPHVLRAGPGKDHERVRLLDGSDYAIEILEIDGDWIKARVVAPYFAACLQDLAGAEVYEGWLKWRSPEQGPWIWRPTYPCD